MISHEATEPRGFCSLPRVFFKHSDIEARKDGFERAIGESGVWAGHCSLATVDCSGFRTPSYFYFIWCAANTAAHTKPWFLEGKKGARGAKKQPDLP